MRDAMRHQTRRQGQALNLLLFLGGGAALALALWWLTGPPALPAFDLNQLSGKFSRSEVSSDDAISVASLIAWAALLYLGLIIAVQLALAFVLKVTDGATWAATAQQFANLATLPPVRRMVNAAVIGVIVVGLWKERGDASAATTQPALVAHVATPMLTATDAGPTQAALLSGGRQIRYSVSDGESLWSVARRLYGDGTNYVTLLRANQGQDVTTGARLEHDEPLRAGWAIGIPLPTPNLWIEEDRALYRVQSGDSLWRIAESFLGSGFRWTDIWDLNQNRVMIDGRSFTNPDLIIPGWVLEIPGEATIPTPSEQEPTAPFAEPQPEEPVEFDLPELEPTWPVEVAIPAATSDAQPEAPRSGTGGPSIPWPGELTVLTTAAGLGAIVPAYLLVRALRRRSGTPRESIPWHDRKQARGDAGRVVLAARALMAALRDEGFKETRLTLVREAGRYQDCYLQCPPGDAEAIERLRYELGRRLFCGVDVEIASETDVRIRLSRFQRLAGLLDEGSAEAATMLVPVGGLDNSFYYLSLAAYSTVLLSGTQEQTAQLTSSWLQTLLATCSPEELCILIDDELAAGVSGWSDRSPSEQTTNRPARQLIEELEDMVIARENSDGLPQATVLAVMPFVAPALSSRLETLYHRARESRITLVLVAPDEIETDALLAGGAVVAYANASVAQQIDGWDGEGDLVLMPGPQPPLGLYGTEVRRDVLSREVRETARHHLAKESPFVEKPPGFGLREDEVEEDEDSSEDDEREESLPLLVEDGHRHFDYWLEKDEPEEAARSVSDSEVSYRPGAETERGEPQAGPELDEDSGEDARTTLDEGTEPVDLTLSQPQYASNGFGATERQLLLGIRSGTTDGSDPEAQPLFTVSCLGHFDVSIDGESLTRWRVAKSRELLALLVVHKNGRVSREAAIEALWPDALPEQTESFLTDTMYRLRTVLRAAAGRARETEIVTSRHQHCQVDLSLFRIDLRAFDAHISRAAELERGDALAEYEQAFTLYRGDLLGDEPFEWAGPYRQEYRDRFVAATKRAGTIALDCRDTARAVDFFRMVLDLEPIDEEAVSGLMRAYARRADVNGVRKAYKVLCEALRRDLEDAAARPLPDTETLFAELTRDSEA